MINIPDSILNLLGKFHSHTTVLCDDDNMVRLREIARGLSCSITVIDLERDKNIQRDIMLTKHFHTERSPQCDTVDDIKRILIQDANTLAMAGFHVYRIKLEHESLPTITPSKEHYREIHFKCIMPENDRDDIIEAITRFDNTLVPSSNVFARHTDGTITQFINKRYYNGSIEEVDDNSIAIEQVLVGLCDVKEIKRESVVYDTNHQHDSWWA